MAEVFLREYGDIANLVKAVPHREQRGFFTADIQWTCVDFTSDWVAVGTETGWLYLYDRFEESVKHRLTTQLSDRSALTKVRLKRSVEYVVAMGTTSGFVSIFRLPTPLAGLNVDLQAFGIRGLHHSCVTSLEWSQNAMKLFSGDEDGVIVCTEIDYTTNQSRSYIICKEPHSIVQLSYAHKMLLVSTRWRAILCNPDDVMNVTQVGRKDRKSLGPFGSIFVPGSLQPQDAVVYCARPNLSLWKADIAGTVSLTVIFKTLAANLDDPIGVSLLPDKDAKRSANASTTSSAHFSRLFVFNRELILSHFENGIFVVNPRSGQFVCFQNALPEIIDIAVQDDEILLLTKRKNGTLRYLAQHAFRTRLPSYLTGNPLQLTTHETQPGHKTIEGISDLTAKPSTVSMTTVSMTKSLFGVLIENVIGTVQDGTTTMKPPPGESTGNPETGEEMQSPGSAETDEAAPRISIPIVKLDPNEIVPLRIEPNQPDQEQIRPPVNATNSVDKSSEEIVYKSKRKTKTGKKTKSLRPQTPDIVSISSGDSAQRDRSVSPVDPDRQATSRGQRSSPCHQIGAIPLMSTADLPRRSVSPLRESQDLDIPPKSPTILPSEICSRRLPSREFVSLDALTNPETDIRLDSALTSCSYDETLRSENQLANVSVEASKVSSNRNHDLFAVELGNDLAGSLKIESSAEFAFDRIRQRDNSCREVEGGKNPPAKLEEKSELKPEDKVEDFMERNKETLTEFQKVEDLKPDLKPKEMEISDGVENASVAGNVPTPSSPFESFTSIYHTTSNNPEGNILEMSRSDPRPDTGGQPMTSFDLLSNPSVVEKWSEIIAPSSLKFLSLCNTHAWCIDKQDGVYYTTIGKPGKWVKVDQTGQKLSVSPNGFILWILSKNSVYAASKVSSKSPAGSEWREIIREVKSLSVDDHVAWYSKLNGEVLMQKDLKKERTSFRAIRISCEYHVTDVFCGRGVVWAVTDDLLILVRAGIGKGHEEGTKWETLERQSMRLLSFSLSFGSDDLVWMMDFSGRIWFTSGVTSSSPHGSGIWWEVAISDICSSCDAVPPSSGKTWSLWERPSSLSRSTSWVDSGTTGDAVATNTNGEVWVNFGKGQSIFASNGLITGHRWEPSTPSGMLPTTKWRRISCCDDEGIVLVWLEQSNGDIFCISSVASDDRVVEIPPPLFNDAILSLAATGGALWCVTKGGKMFVRGGMSSHCVQGVHWISVDLSQLGNVKIVHLSASEHNVWAVDSLGNSYIRVGVKPPSNKCINAAWLEVDQKNLPGGTHLAQVVSSPNSSMVWALDTRKNVYIRAGVTERLPLGTKWIIIPGHSFESIHVSNRHVYGLNAKDDIFMRYGISRTNPFGDFWKRIPGKFRHIGVSGGDNLWAIDPTDLLNRRLTLDLETSSESHRQREKLLSRCDSAESEWEIVN